MTKATLAVPKILVLLGTYNGERWAQGQVDSVLSQEFVETHVHIGDDASVDGTWGLLSSLYGENPRVCLRHWTTPSGSAGGNFRRLYAISDLQGFDYVALADQDDIWRPAKLRSAVDKLLASGASGYSCAVEAFWPDGREQILRQSDRRRAADFLFEGAGQGCTFVLTVAFFNRVQLFCRTYEVAAGQLHYHDWLLYLLARAWGERWVFDPDAWIRYRQHGGNEIGARHGLAAFTRRLGLIRNGWYARQVRAAADLYRLAGGQDPRVLTLADRLQNETGRDLSSRFGLMLSALIHGRRSLTDRLVLGAAALAGWI